MKEKKKHVSMKNGSKTKKRTNDESERWKIDKSTRNEKKWNEIQKNIRKRRKKQWKCFNETEKNGRETLFFRGPFCCGIILFWEPDKGLQTDRTGNKKGLGEKSKTTSYRSKFSHPRLNVEGFQLEV